MTDSPQHETRVLLRRAQEGEAGANDELFELVLGELRGLARRFMADQKSGHTLQPTALVNEAWMRLAGHEAPIEGRGAFLRLAAAAMRSILIDHARRKSAEKRGGGARPAPLDKVDEPGGNDPADAVLEIDEALGRLAKRDETAAKVAELRCFGGLEHAEVAEALDLPLRTVERHWSFARSFLERELGPE